MNKKLAIVGGGDLAEQLLNMITHTGIQFDKIVYFDDVKFDKGEKDFYRFNDYMKTEFDDFEFCICLGYKHLEKKTKIINNLKSSSRKLFTFIHTTAHIDKTSIIGKGVIIYPMCNIDYKVELMDGVILNNSVVVSHESVIGSSSFISPGTVIAGKVKIGSSVFIGTGSRVSSLITIGNSVRVGIGSVITKNIGHNLSVIGNPMRILDHKLEIL